MSFDYEVTKVTAGIITITVVNAASVVVVVVSLISPWVLLLHPTDATAAAAMRSVVGLIVVGPMVVGPIVVGLIVIGPIAIGPVAGRNGSWRYDDGLVYRPSRTFNRCTYRRCGGQLMIMMMMITMVLFNISMI